MLPSQPPERPPTVAVLGGGTFGLALSAAVRRSIGEVILWSRRSRDAEESGVRTTTAIEEAAACDLIFLSVPSAHAGAVLEQIAPHLDGARAIVHVSRGLVDDQLRPISHLIRTTTPCRRIGALAGPLTASLLRDGKPGGGIVGSDFPEVVEDVRAALDSKTLRLYGTGDLTGVELASAFTGMLLFAVGFARGLGLEPATLGVLATRGVAEVARLGAALGADERTFHGLACVGDLFAALAGEARPEMLVGHAVATGSDLTTALGSAEVSVESRDVALRVSRLADRVRVEMPITETLGGLLSGKLSTADAMTHLMARRVSTE